MFFINIALMFALIMIASITIGIDILLVPVALEKPRETYRLPKTYQIKRDAKRYDLYTLPQYKYYRLVFITKGWSILLPSKPTRTDIMTWTLS